MPGRQGSQARQQEEGFQRQLRGGAGVRVEVESRGSRAGE